MFYSSLHFAIVNSGYSNIDLKPKQVKCLEGVYFGKDVVAVLPTGYGKSIIYHLLPSLFYNKINCSQNRMTETSALHPVIIVVSPLNALIKDQIRKTSQGNIKATVLSVKNRRTTDDLDLDYDDATSLRDAKYDIVYMHPEAVISCSEGIELLQSKPYQRSVKAIIIDEAHCILEWGDDFRKDYSQLAMLCANFHDVPVVALTATAGKADVITIKESLNLKKPVQVTANPNRPNIFYEKIFRKGEDIDLFEELLQGIASELIKRKVDYPLTILYLPLRWCGFGFKFLDKQLSREQYYPPNSEALPENRLLLLKTKLSRN